MTVVLAIIAVQASLGALLFGTALIDRPSGSAAPEGHAHVLRLPRRRPR